MSVAETALRSPLRVEGYAPIGDYAAIGDRRALALVALDGTIDWLALPTLDGEPLFAALLDAERGGSFSLQPTGEFQATRRYLPDTNVLETRFSAARGTATVTDALTLSDAPLPWIELARAVECTAGELTFEWAISAREAGDPVEVGRERGVPVLRGRDQRVGIFCWGGEEPKVSSGEIRGQLQLAAGERALLTAVGIDLGAPLPAPTSEAVSKRLEATIERWRRWTERHGYDGPWHDAVTRGALALALLTNERTGAIAAAATTSLPESIGGSRNWDYRFSWVRDSSFALDALLRLDRREEVQASLAWLLSATERTHPRLNVLYGLGGGVPSGCEVLPFTGYRGSRPVRAGNAAAGQTQLGCYGDLFETVWLYVQDGNALGPELAIRLAEKANYVCEIWRNEDSGIWELQGQERHYTTSKIGCWVALDRAVRLAELGLIPPDGSDRWRRERVAVREFVELRCWSEQRGSYAFYAGTDDLDASVLLAARSGFADPRGERMAGTIQAIRGELAEGPLVYRYTGARRMEGAFLACSFWLVQALARAERVVEATALMDELVGLANDVGLYSEELDPASRELLGNFPQALTHLALISAAGAVDDMHEKEDT